MATTSNWETNTGFPNRLSNHEIDSRFRFSGFHKVYRDSTHRLDGSEQNVWAISERHRTFSGSKDETTFRNKHKLFPKVYIGFWFKGCTVQKMHEGISAKVRPIHTQTVPVELRRNLCSS
jgi:hypothetical protein